MGRERLESYAAGIGMFVLVELLGIAATSVLAATEYVLDGKPSANIVIPAALATTVFAVLCGHNAYRDARESEPFRLARREAVVGRSDV